MSFDPKYYGVPPAQQIQKENRYAYTATASQTTFTASYTPGFGPDVYYNGSHLDPRTQFTAVDGATVVLATGADAGASIIIVAKAQVANYSFYTQAETNALAGNFYASSTSGTTSAITATTNPSFSSWLFDGMEVKVRMTVANPGGTTAPTISLNGLSAMTIVREGQQPLTGGDWNANDEVTLRYSAAFGNLTLMSGKVTALSPSALNNSNVYATTAYVNASGPVVGSARNLAMIIGTAGTSGTMTADEIVVKTALGGAIRLLTSFSQTINLANVGANGMDTGSAPASGFVALYAIYNPTTSTAALLATNATAAVAPNVYGGANMPSGYTASALVSVWPTNSSSQFIVGSQYDRTINFAATGVYSGTGSVSLATINLAGIVPKNAKSASGSVSITVTTSGISSFNIFSQTATGSSTIVLSVNTGSSTGGGNSNNFPKFPILTSQTWYISSTQGATISNMNVAVVSYDI
jgi:hypothetical protein